jgi:ArsR family transcriptional regulator
MTEAEEMKALADEFAACKDAFIALGDETRIHMIEEMLRRGDNHGLRVGEICEITSLSRPAVSHHMKYLKDAGIVKVRKEGTMNFYYLDAKKTKFAEIGALMEKADRLAKNGHGSSEK